MYIAEHFAPKTTLFSHPNTINQNIFAVITEKVERTKVFACGRFFDRGVYNYPPHLKIAHSAFERVLRQRSKNALPGVGEGCFLCGFVFQRLYALIEPLVLCLQERDALGKRVVFSDFAC